MKLSKFISIILHPLWMPLFSVYLSLNYVPSLKLFVYNSLDFIYLSILVYTVILPLISVLFLIKLRVLGSLEMSHLNERCVALFITFFWMSFGLFSLQNILNFVPILNAVLLGGCVIVLLAGIISLSWKISLHMLGAGGLFGGVIAISFLYNKTSILILLLILFSGMLGSARLHEKAHTLSQLYIGYLIGIITEIIVVLNY